MLYFMKETIVFEISHEDDGYSASASGENYFIVTQGDTFEELKKNIQEAVSLHLEGEYEESQGKTHEVSLLANIAIPFPA